eukprot:981297_1
MKQHIVVEPSIHTTHAFRLCLIRRCCLNLMLRIMVEISHLLAVYLMEIHVFLNGERIQCFIRAEPTVTVDLFMDHAQFVDTQGLDYGSAITVEYADYNIDMNAHALPLSLTIQNALFDTNALIGNISYGGNAITFLAHHSHTFQQMLVYNSTFTNNDYSSGIQSLYGGHVG